MLLKERLLGNAMPGVAISPESLSSAQYDVVVVGAGPYGLSTAAHLLARGLSVAVFGKTLELWRKHMPTGMLLRSHWWASNLSDPREHYVFARFLGNSKQEKRYPMPINAFIGYGIWFQEHAAPKVDETYVSSLARQGDHFLLTLEDGRKVESTAVVMATGLQPYAHRPERYTRLPTELVSHSCDHNDFNRFKGQQIIVIGGGQSAVEYSALLHEAGAAVHIVSRRPISWLTPDRTNERPLSEQILAPNNGIAPGWKEWVLEHMPYFFYRFPQPQKDRWIRNYFVAAASDWLRARVIGKVILHEGHTIVEMKAVDGKVDVTISDGERTRADHVILATGYKVDIDRLTMIHPSLRSAIRADGGVPTLSPWFESSVPGLYFVGLTSMRAFGPVYRFVLGCKATAPRVAKSIARNHTKRTVAYTAS